ncbi:MAG TPA: c-type cytochrome [Pyrinomonadaceae bacterium]
MKQRNLKLFALALFTLAAALTFISSGHAGGPQPAPGPFHAEASGVAFEMFETARLELLLPGEPGPQGAQGERTVEQTRKNIQVLKGLPDSQLFTVMNFIGSSLGVNCAFCHVNSGGDKWEWEKDDKPEKVIARKMIQMQFDINKGNRDIFGRTGAVSCYTCHRGQTMPALMPALPLAHPGGAGGAAAPGAKGAAAEALPSVDQVLDRYVQALGGRAALERSKTRVMKGSQTTADGTSMPLEFYMAAPNKVASVLTTKAGPVMSGFNGTTAWVKNQRGQRELSGAQLAQVRRSADFYGDLHLKDIYPGLTFAGREKLGDREVYVLSSQVADNRTEKLYFDTQTGLLVRILAVTQTMLSPIPEQTDFDDYRDVDGVKFPFTVRQSFIDARNGWTRKYMEVKQNVPIDEAKFNAPPAAK